MLRLFKHYKPIDWVYLLVIVLLAVGQTFLDLKMPEFTQELTKMLNPETIINPNEVWFNGGMMILVAFAGMCCSIGTGFFSSHMSADFARTLRSKLFQKVNTFTDREINKFTTPSLITRTTNDVVQVQQFIAFGIQIIIRAPILSIWAITKISFINIEWTMAVLITVIVMVVSIGLILLLVLPKFKKIQKLTDDLNQIARENISGVRVIRAYNAEDHQQEKFEKVNNNVTKNNLYTMKIMALLMPILTLCMNGLTVAIYWIAAVLINRAPTEALAIISNTTAFTQYAFQVVLSFILLIVVFVIMPRAMVSAKRIREVLNTEPSIIFDENGKDFTDGLIEFKHVNFAYPNSQNNSLENISFCIKPNQTFAIIGATGCGKTTIVNLLSRFFDTTGGEILIDGIDIKKLSKKSLEKLISLAPQKAILFKGTIASNVSYGSTPDQEKLENALQIAQCDFVNSLEKGIDSPVAQGGTNFSGGQKQRLSIARAVYKNSKVIIFDDTFSALDYKTDMLVRKNIKEKVKDSSIIIVAQRIGTIMNADQILVLDNGKVVGIGKHKDLLENCKIYKEIALSQLKEEEL